MLADRLGVDEAVALAEELSVDENDIVVDDVGVADSVSALLSDPGVVGGGEAIKVDDTDVVVDADAPGDNELVCDGV